VRESSFFLLYFISLFFLEFDACIIDSLFFFWKEERKDFSFAPLSISSLRGILLERHLLGPFVEWDQCVAKKGFGLMGGILGGKWMQKSGVELKHCQV